MTSLTPVRDIQREAFGRFSAGIIERRLVNPIPAPVSRDVCCRCGARGDFDCGHKATRLIVRAA